MEREISKVDVLISSLSQGDNVAAEASLAGAGLSEPLVMDVKPIQVVAPTEHKAETGNGEGESLETGVPEGDKNEKEDLAEEGEYDELAAEEGNADFNHVYADGDRDEEDDDDGDYDYDDDDDDDDDEEEKEDEDDNDEEEDLMEEDVGVKNKDDNVGDDNEETPTKVESEDEENKEKVPKSSEAKVEKLKKVRVFKKVVQMNLDKATVENKDNSERDEKNDPMEEAGDGNIKGATEEKGGESSKDKVKKLRRRGGNKKMASKPERKPSSSRGKKGGPKRAESMGMIFICSSKTKKDCYRYQVLGLPAAKRDVVEKIYKGMRLFLYDVDLKLMYGIYKAAGRGGYNIEPKAFKSQFPSQVRFTVLDDCVPLAEEKFKKAIKENYYTKNKFDCLLKHEQVKNLCKLFMAASKGSKSKSLDRSLKAEARASKRQSRPRAPGVDERRRSALGEKYRYHDYPHSHQREVVASPAARAPRISPLPPPVAAPRYAYDRTIKMDPYRRSMLVEHANPHRQPYLEARDAYRRPLLSDYRDVYRQESPLGHYDAYRRDGVPERRDLRPLDLDVRHRDEIARREPYTLPGERQSYHDPVYGEHLSLMHDRYRYVPTEYRSTAPPMTDYHSTRSLYRY